VRVVAQALRNHKLPIHGKLRVYSSMKLVLVVLLASCGSSRREPVRVPSSQANDAAMVADGGSGVASTLVSVAVDATVPVDAALPFRPFVAPARIASPGAPTPQTKACRNTADADWAHERARELAALDAALRAKGGMVLATVLFSSAFDDSGYHQIGDVVRGGRGERFMVVAQQSLCPPDAPPLIGIDRGSEVFLALPQLKPKDVRKVSQCQPVCGGCGVEPPISTFVVEVPDGARFVGMRDVSVPIDVEVDLVSLDSNGVPKRCPPVP
jgi:hypothetical protein